MNGDGRMKVSREMIPSRWGGFVWLALVVAVAPTGLAQDLPHASELTHRVLELRRAANIRAHGRLVHTDATKHQRVVQISMLQKGLAQRTNLLWSVTDPPDARSTRALVLRRSRNQWGSGDRNTVLQGCPTAVATPSSNWTA